LEAKILQDANNELLSALGEEKVLVDDFIRESYTRTLFLTFSS